jgi:hypothetical protein
VRDRHLKFHEDRDNLGSLNTEVSREFLHQWSPPRNQLMNQKAELLVKLLDERYGLAITEDVAGEDIPNHVDRVAGMMRIRRQAAKYYVTDDVVEGFAAHIATAVGANNVVDLDAHRLQRTFPPPPQ